MERRLTKEDLMQKLWQAVNEAGSQTALASKIGVTKSYLCDVLHGRREFSENMAASIGVQRETVYTER